MSDNGLRDLARCAGVSTSWIDVKGGHHDVSLDVLRAVLTAFGLQAATAGQIANSLVALRHVANDAALPPLLVATAGEPIRPPALPCFHAVETYRIALEDGTFVEGVIERADDGFSLPALANPGYHELHIGDEATVLAVAPGRCFSIDDIERRPERKLWGLAAPLYALRRKGDGGIGDFSALSEAARAAAALGASAFAINPVHALFSAAPERFSPYAPSSRAFLNPLHADPAIVLGEAAVKEALHGGGGDGLLAQLESLDLIDWPRAARARLALMRRLFKSFSATDGPAKEDFLSFRAGRGEALEDHARFEALHAVFLEEDPSFDDWRNWPSLYRDPRGQAVLDFAIARADEVTFHIFLQWLAARGFASAQKACLDAGMAIGLIADLAVGADAKGSHAWSRQGEMLPGLTVGAPPDPFNAHGQTWGIAALSPHAMRPHGFRAFVEALRASMAHGGGVRIDHAMGLARLWVVPEGAAPTEGTYVHYPADDLFRLVALESWKNRAIVMGEDLGTVAEGFREKLYSTGILGTEVMWFQRDDDRFFAPSIYSPNAMATTTTHDLPTVAGWWRGDDIEARASAGVISHEEATEANEARYAERRALWQAFRSCGAAEGEMPDPGDPGDVADAAAAFVGMTPSPLAILPLDDALGRTEQANMPGTFDEYPNWRFRLPREVRALFDDPRLRERLRRLARMRPHREP